MVVTSERLALGSFLLQEIAVPSFRVETGTIYQRRSKRGRRLKSNTFHQRSALTSPFSSCLTLTLYIDQPPFHHTVRRPCPARTSFPSLREQSCTHCAEQFPEGYQELYPAQLRRPKKRERRKAARQGKSAQRRFHFRANRHGP